ncbi:MAG: hypothetical protein KUG77_19070 [Nannocystaceae bacterium]|nr:hypothetical protein [Nannocystaceae bacterium]
MASASNCFLLAGGLFAQLLLGCGEASEPEGATDAATTGPAGTTAADATGVGASTAMDATATGEAVTGTRGGASDSSSSSAADTGSTGGVSGVDYEPCLVAGFDIGQPETLAEGPGAFPPESSEVFSRTLHDNTRAYDGSGSARIGIEEGATGFGQYGGIMYLGDACTPTGHLERGSEVWIRARYYVPQSWRWLPEGHSNKFLRLRTFVPGGESQGYDDLYIQPHPSETIQGFRFIYEGIQQWANVPTPEPFAADAWTTIEYYLRFDHLTEAEGGQARIRVWQDGVLLADIDDRATLTQEDGYANDFLLFTYYGDEPSPQTQDLWVDDLIIATDQSPPTVTDDAGNPMIGAEVVVSDW